MIAQPDDAFPPDIRRFPQDSDGYRLKAEHCDVVFATYPRGMVLEPHTHDDVNIVGVVTAGLVQLTVDGDERAYGPGDWFHVPTSVVHSARYEETTMQVELFFPPDW